MFRLLRFVPLALPLVLRFFRSPQGKSLIAKIRGRGTDGSGTGGTTGSTPRH